MNDSEKQTIVFIPRNFIEKGTFMGGMFKIRNAIEGGILAVLIAVPVIQLPLSLTVRIIILCMTALPAAMISLIGIGGESISAFLMNALRFLKNRRVIYRMSGSLRYWRIPHKYPDAGSLISPSVLFQSEYGWLDCM